jgi:glycosyltransferase involved in cell wall biosynthesis
MKKYKICVYAICKNEEKFVERWINSVKEADAIYVLDTGSTDNTVEKLKALGANVTTKEITPWRFDVARNLSLDLVPQDTDICICIDLDEVLDEGWREKLESIWTKETTRLRYNYIWSFDEYKNPAVNFYTDKIHQRKDYHWKNPVHEILVYEKETENFITTDEITLKHYPDSTKSRSQYLPLLELSVKEDPTDDRNMHYLGREYMYHGNYSKAIETLKKHLSLEKSTWKDERCASMRFIARCYNYLNDKENAKIWFQKSCQEAPYLREPFVEYGIFMSQNKNYEEAEALLKQALSIPKNTKTYINEPYCYDGSIEDNLSICLFYNNKKEESIGYAIKASILKPNDERIKNNIEIIKELL